MKTIKIELNRDDYQKLNEKSAMVDMTPERIITLFVSDLIDGTATQGSDERMYAELWFERSGFEVYAPNTFLKWLLEEYRIQEFVGLIDDQTMAKENIEEEKSNDNPDMEFITQEQQALESITKDIDEIWNEYQTILEPSDSDFKSAKDAVLKWHRENYS